MGKTAVYLLIFFSTCSGLSVYGQIIVPTLETFNMANSPMPDNTVRCLLVDNLGDLWIGTDNGLAHLSNNTWEVFNEANSGLDDNYVRALAVDANNAIWIGTTMGGVQKFDGTTWVDFNTDNSDIPDNFIRTISIDHFGNKWIGTVEGLVYFDDTSWRTWTMANSPILTNNISSIAIGQQNEKYIGTINGGLIYIDNDTVITGIYYILNSGVPDNSALTVKMDQVGKPWFAGSAGGLWTDQGNQTWMAFNWTNSPMPTNSLTTMTNDEEDNFYLGTQIHGLVIKRANQTWGFYNTDNSDIAENHVMCIAKDGNDNVWIGTFSKGLVRLKEDYLSTDELSADQALKVFPNPVKSNEAVHFSGGIRNPQITITSPDAKTVYKERFSTTINSFTLPELNSGTYLLTVETENRLEVIRIMIL